MSFRSELYTYIKTNIEPLLPYDLYYGAQSPATDAPFYRMILISDSEQPEVICEQQGQAGQALIQFDFNGGNTSVNASLGWAEDELEKLKVLVASLRGDIGTFTVWQNFTGGVQSIGDPTAQWWGVLFESTLGWNKN
jgi:hypothetical protein